jgi:hypothetical protein
VTPRKMQETIASVTPRKVQETAASVPPREMQEIVARVQPTKVQDTRVTRAEPNARVVKGRPTKFTPDRLEQIRELVALGKGRDEIVLRSDAVVEREAGSANLLLTMEYRGRKRTIPLPFSNDTISMLAFEAQVREMSLGQLLGTILAAATAGGLPRLLDGDAREKAA